MTKRKASARRAILVFAHLLAVALLVVAVPYTASAQDPGQQPVLPDLAPREMEIRGELIIQFPLLERQPLLGFNPPPRIPEIPADRQPLVDDYKQERADLPQTTIERPDPPTAMGSSAGPVRGEVEAAAGSYLSRLVRVRAGGQVSPSTSIRASLDYLGSDGSEIVALQRVENPFDSMDGSVAVDYEGRSMRAGATVGGFADYYSLFGLASRLPAVEPSFENGPDRTANGVRIAARVASPRGAATSYSMGARWSYAGFETTSDSTFSPDERRIDLDAGLSVPAGITSVGVDIRAGTSGLNTSGFVGSSQQYIDAGLGGSLTRRSGITGSLKVRVLGARYDSPLSLTGEQRKLLYLSPEVDVVLPIAAGFSLFAGNAPSIEVNSLQDVYRRSPFIAPGASFGPGLNVVDARAGVRLTFATVVFEPYAAYRWSPNQLYYAANVVTVNEPNGVVTTRSGRVATIAGGASLSVGLTGSLTAAVTGEYREAELTDLDVPVPYLPTVATTGGITWSFLEERALARVQARYEGVRHVEETESRELHAITSLDLLASFDITRNIGLTFRGLNLTDSPLERWDTYRMTGRQFLGGLRIRW